MEVTIGLAFFAGLASFLSPCVLSLIPVYVGYLAGRSASTGLSRDNSGRPQALWHGLAFVLGFSLVFILLGLAFSAIGSLLYEMRGVLAKIGGVIVIFFGLYMTGIIRIRFLEYDLRPQSSVDRKRGLISSFLMGVFFSAGWSPCVGPVLGSILVIAFNQGSISNGILLLTAYSAGMAIPFLLAAAGIGWTTQILQRYRKALRVIEVVMGFVMIVVGVLLFLGTFETLARYGSLINTGI